MTSCAVRGSGVGFVGCNATGRLYGDDFFFKLYLPSMGRTRASFSPPRSTPPIRFRMPVSVHSLRSLSSRSISALICALFPSESLGLPVYDSVHIAAQGIFGQLCSTWITQVAP